ncbi:uncharacterized protein isoform X1 [Rhodnius prolixus]|uniref:uncharacterized protein isoform X1 n=1 Tax=Rhodnius prolixus TaxID=13249 RepID=UPI003D1881FF
MSESNYEQRCALRFYFRSGHSATEALGKLRQDYGDIALSRAQVFRWFKAFSEGREVIGDDPRSGRPSSSRTDENVDKIRELVRADRRMTVRMIAHELNLTHTTVHQILTNELEMSKICSSSSTATNSERNVSSSAVWLQKEVQNADRCSDMECSDSADVPESEASPKIVIKTEVVSADEMTTAEQKEIKEEAENKTQETPSQSAKPVYVTTDKQNHQPSSHSEVNENGQPKGTKRRLQKLTIAINELRKVNTILNQPEPSVQENVAFGTYVASVMNKLHPQQAILAQNEIQNILTRYRMDSATTTVLPNNVTINQRPVVSPQPQSPSSASSSSSQ